MNTTTAAPCALCGTLGGASRADSRTPTRVRHLCQQCYEAARWHGTREQWPTYRYDAHPTVPTGIVTPAMLGIKAGDPPTDPNLSPRVVWAVGNLNARKAIGWLVARGMDPEEARRVATWQPAMLDATVVAA